MKQEDIEPIESLKDAFLKGVKIQCSVNRGRTWGGTSAPQWKPSVLYRRKPEINFETAFNQTELRGVPKGHIVTFGGNLNEHGFLRADNNTHFTFIDNQEHYTMKFETKYFLNGQDISTLSDAQIYKAIKDAEDAIAKLEQIRHKPKKLIDDISNRNGDLKMLLNYLNDRDEEERSRASAKA